MLSRGSLVQIYEVFKAMPPNIQVCLFSATMASNIWDLVALVTRDAVRLLFKRNEITLEGIRQFYVAIEKEEWKLDTMCDLLETFETLPMPHRIIYCNTRRKVEFLADQLSKRGFMVSTLH